MTTQKIWLREFTDAFDGHNSQKAMFSVTSVFQRATTLRIMWPTLTMCVCMRLWYFCVFSCNSECYRWLSRTDNHGSLFDGAFGYELSFRTPFRASFRAAFIFGEIFLKKSCNVAILMWNFFLPLSSTKIVLVAKWFSIASGRNSELTKRFSSIVCTIYL